MTRITRYKETVTDFHRYFSGCYFLGNGKYKGCIIKVSNKILISKEYCNPDENGDHEDEYSDGESETGVIAHYDDAPGHLPFIGMVSDIINKRTFKYVSTDVVVDLRDLCFNKPFSGITVIGSDVVSVVYSNMQTFKKGIYKYDYHISRIIDPDFNKPRLSDEELFLRSILQEQIVKPTKKEIEALLNCKIPAVQLSKRYALVNEDNYDYPTLWYLNSRIGYIDNNFIIHTKYNGNVINGLKYVYSSR